MRQCRPAFTQRACQVAAYFKAKKPKSKVIVLDANGDVTSKGPLFKKAWADPASGMVFCLSEAPNAEAVKKIHEKAGHPTDEVYPVPVQA